jgi:hypothetical protein
MNPALINIVHIRDSAQICWTAGDGPGFASQQKSTDLQGFNAVWQGFHHRDKGMMAGAFSGIACASLTQCGWQPAIN